MRLNRYLSFCGVCSRREADRMIEEGRVVVNGRKAVLGQDVSGKDRVVVGSRIVTPVEEEIFLAVYKPRGVVVTTDRSHGDRIIGDLVPVRPRVFAVGRLDKESEGLILMTNNGGASNRIQKSGGHHEKEYQVTVDREVTPDQLSRLSGGIWLEELGRMTRPCEVKKTGRSSFDIILTEGMNRQIRRMCAVLGLNVLALKRVRIMNITLGTLKPGQYRQLTEEEVRTLKSLL